MTDSVGFPRRRRFDRPTDDYVDDSSRHPTDPAPVSWTLFDDSSTKEERSSTTSPVPSSAETTTVVVMPAQDRTQEFRITAKSAQMKLQANCFVRHPNAVLHDVGSSNFSKIAKTIGHDLCQTCVKLEKLTLLARKKSLFHDRFVEMDELTNYIKQDIASLNKQIAILQEMLQRQRDKMGMNRSQHSQSVVVTLQSKLATMSTEFKNVLELRTENMKQEKFRREKFSSNQAIPSTLPPSASQGNMGSLLLNDSASEAPRSRSFVMDMDDMDKRRVQQQMQLIDEQDSYVRSRVETMASIESTIVDLGQIFQQLSHMIQEQGEVVQRIDSNVEETSLNVETAHMELLKYFRGISQNRWLAIKVFGVLVLFFIFFVVFFL